MEKHGTIGMGRLIAGMALFVVLGIPLVGYLWETLNELLAGHVDGTRLLISLPVLALLGALLAWLGRRVWAWEGRHVD